MGSPLTHRALVAVLLMVGFYGLMLALAAGILALLGVYVYYVFVYGQDFDVPEEALLLAAALAGGILWSLLPQLDHFDPPGPPLAAQEHPRLFAILQELTAATLIGRSTLADGLLALERWGAIQAAYLEDEVNPVLRAGFRPPIAEGFRRTMQAVAAKDEASAEETAPPPRLSARLAGLAERPEGPSPTPAEQESAITLLDDLDGAEAALVSHMRSAFTYRTHELIAWEEVDARLHAKRSTQTSPRPTKRSTSSTSARRGRRATGGRRRGRPDPDGS